MSDEFDWYQIQLDLARLVAAVGTAQKHAVRGDAALVREFLEIAEHNQRHAYSLVSSHGR